jgi:hypothetical protein
LEGSAVDSHSARKSSLPQIERGVKNSNPIIELDEVISHEGQGLKFVIDDPQKDMPITIGLESIKEINNVKDEFSH